jgi:hypothetical protein
MSKLAGRWSLRDSDSDWQIDSDRAPVDGHRMEQVAFTKIQVVLRHLQIGDKLFAIIGFFLQKVLQLLAIIAPCPKLIIVIIAYLLLQLIVSA